MSGLKTVRHTATVVTNSGGAATYYLPGGLTTAGATMSGIIKSIRYVKDTYDNGVGVTLTLNQTGEAVWSEANVNSSATRYPRPATQSVAGVAAIFASGGEVVMDQAGIPMANDQIKIVIASGGATKSGTFHVTLET